MRGRGEAEGWIWEGQRGSEQLAVGGPGCSRERQEVSRPGNLPAASVSIWSVREVEVPCWSVLTAMTVHVFLGGKQR